MKILHTGARSTVIHGDWRAIGLKPREVDVVLTDPPYTEHVHGNVRSCNTTGAVKVEQYDLDFEHLTDYSHVPEFLEIARRWVINFCALEQLGEYRLAAGGDWSAKRKAEKGNYVRSGIWRKQQAAPQLSGDRPANSCEGWAVMHARYPGMARMRWNGRGKHAYFADEPRFLRIVPQGDRLTEELLTIEAANTLMKRKGGQTLPAPGESFVWDDGALIGLGDLPSFVEHGRERSKKRHPAQKPRALCADLVEKFTDPGELVLDAYAGGGNLGITALELGREVILCDIDEEWAHHCAARAKEIDP